MLVKAWSVPTLLNILTVLASVFFPSVFQYFQGHSDRVPTSSLNPSADTDSVQLNKYVDLPKPKKKGIFTAWINSDLKTMLH